MRLRIIGPDDPALQVLQAALAAHPEWQAELEILPWPAYTDRLMAALTAVEAPDQAVFIPGHVRLPELAAAGFLAPLDPLIAAAPSDLASAYRAEEILPSVAAEGRYRGETYMLPFFSDGHILVYRPDLVELGEGTADEVPVVDPRDLADLAQRAADRAAEAGLAGVLPLALKAHPSEILLDWLPFLWAEDGQILDGDGRPAFAGPAGVRALERYCALRRFCPDDTHLYGNGEIAAALRSGSVAMATTWGGQAAAIMLDPSSPARELYRTALFPTPWNATWGVAIPANQPREVQEAMLAVLLQAMGPEQDREVTRVAGSPVRRSSYAPAELARYSWLAAQEQMLARCRTLPVDPRMGGFLGDLYEAVYAAFTGERSPESALGRAEAAALQVLGG